MTESNYVEIELDLDKKTILQMDNLAKEMNLTRDQVVEYALTEYIKSVDPKYYEQVIKPRDKKQFGDDIH